MHTGRTVRLLFVAAAVLVACGDADTNPADDTTTTAAAVASTEIAETISTVRTATTDPTTTTGATTSAETATSTEATTATDATTTTTTEAVEPEAIAIWPASDVVHETPEEAAEDFILKVFGVEPLLGEFRQGDSRSGEIEVLSPGDDDDPATVLPTGVLLILRQLGSDDGWFIIAAVSNGVSITSPESMAGVASGSLPIEGVARGHERNVVVRVFVAGDAAQILDLDFTMAGLITPEPYAVTLDLSGATGGDVVALLAVGDTGLADATGEFAAVPVRIVDQQGITR